MRPRTGVQLKAVVLKLRERLMELRNVASSAAGADMDTRIRDYYLRWASDTERVLRGLFTGLRLSELHTDRYWHIRALRKDSPRAYELIRDEVEAQAERLTELADRIEQAAKRLAAPGRIVVLDTNVFLHFERFDRIDWVDVVGEGPLRLVVPLRVVEELDLKTSSQRKDLAKRARLVLAQLESLVGPSAGAPRRLSDHVTIEVPVRLDLEGAEPPRQPQADTEILEICEKLAFLTGQKVTLVTGDVSMRLRAGSGEHRSGGDA